MRRVTIAWIVVLGGCAAEVPQVGTSSRPLEACAALPLAAPPEGRIVFSECRDVGTPTEHLWALGCIDCDGAVYDPNSLLVTNVASLPKIQTTWVLRVPNGWNGRAVAAVPGGNTTHVPYFPWQQMLAAEGFAIFTMNQPLPGHPEVPAGFPGYDPLATAPALMRAGVVLRAVLGSLNLGPVQRVYAHGFSRGNVSGVGLLLDRAEAPFDGYVVGGGGDGYLSRMRLSQQILTSPDQRQPCVDLPLDVSNTSYEVQNARLLGDAFIVEPGYTGSGFDYRIEDRPKEVQAIWDQMRNGANLARPTVIVQGESDKVFSSLVTVKYAVSVVTAGKADLLKLYFFKTRGHGTAPTIPSRPQFPDQLYRDVILNLDAWVNGPGWPEEDAVTERLASEAPAFQARSQVSCQALLGGAPWSGPKCQDDPYKWTKEDLQECPAADHPKVTSCPPWDCYLRVLNGP